MVCAVIFARLRSEARGEERLEQGAQKRLQAQEQAELVAGGGAQGIDAVAVAALR